MRQAEPVERPERQRASNTGQTTGVLVPLPCATLEAEFPHRLTPQLCSP